MTYIVRHSECIYGMYVHTDRLTQWIVGWCYHTLIHLIQHSFSGHPLHIQLGWSHTSQSLRLLLSVITPMPRLPTLVCHAEQGFVSHHDIR